MKIALLKNQMSARGGLEKVTLGLIHAFLRKGAQVTLLTTAGGSTQDPGCPVVHLGYRSKFSLKHRFQFECSCTHWLKAHPQDIVFGLDATRGQTHYRAGNGVHAAYLAQRQKFEPWTKRLSLSLNPLHLFLKKEERAALTSPSLRRLFTNSLMVKKEIETFYGIDEKKILVVPNGVDWKGTSLAFAERTSKRPFTFLFAGNDYHRKGLPFILKALPLLSSYHFRLLIAGKSKGPFPPLPNVTWCGALPDLTPLYQQADALLIPSIYDPCANVTVEALAMGLFVLSSPFNGGAEILTPQTGKIIERIEDPHCMAQAMREALALAHDPYAIRKSVENLDFSHQLDKIVAHTLHD